MRLQSVMTRRAHRLLPIAIVAAAMVLGAGPAAGQTTAKVVAKRSALRASPQRAGAIVTTVPVGTVVEVLGQEGDYYRVLLPADRKGVRLAGFLAMADLALVGQPAAAGKPPAADKPTATQPASQPSRPGARAVPAKRGAFSPITVRGFVDVGHTSFLAADSFGAIFDTARALFPGGGGEVGLGRHLFLRGAVSRTRLKGERAFVHAGEVFRLGIDETLTLTPIEVTAGWTATPFRGLRPYVAGGVGFLKYDERSTLADASENVARTFTSYHVVGGLEIPVWKRVGVAGEFQYTTAPNALGKDGVSQEFRETNLGGTSIHLKLLVGW